MGASNARTASGTDSAGRAGCACSSSGVRSSGALACPPPGARTRSVAALDARDVPTSAPAPASAMTPAGRGGSSHSQPLGSCGSRMPGGTDGRTGTARCRPLGPGFDDAAGAVAAPGAVAAVDRRPAGAGDGAPTEPEEDGTPTGSAGCVTGDGSIPAEEDVVLRGPLCSGGHRGSNGSAEDVASGAGVATPVAGRRRGNGDDGTAPQPDPRRQGGGVPDPPSGATRALRGPGLASPRGRGRRQLTGRHAAGAARCACDGSSASSCHDRLGGLDMHGGNYLHWLVTARVNSHFGKLGPGDGFRRFRTKGDDGGRHRRRRQINRVFMSWRFDRPEFPDLESHSGCRASGPHGRYFPPPEVTPLIGVLHRASSSC